MRLGVWGGLRGLGGAGFTLHEAGRSGMFGDKSPEVEDDVIHSVLCTLAHMVTDKHEWRRPSDGWR